MSSLDWPALLRAGVQGLGMTPDRFWSLTPAELRLMLGEPDARGPLLADGLEALMAAYPDEPGTQKGDRHGRI